MGHPECQVLSGAFATLVQLSLALFAVLTLALKRFLERPQRPWLVWGLDVSKQCCGAAYAHLLNLLISMAISHHLGTDSDQCAWYFHLYIIDVTIGTLMNVLLLSLLLSHADRYRHQRRLWLLLSQNGDYQAHRSPFAAENGPNAAPRHGSDPESLLEEAFLAAETEYLGTSTAQLNVREAAGIWAVQTMAWLGIVSLGKLVILAFLGAIAPILDDMGNWLFGPIQSNPHLELILVMIVVPSICNVLQFWIQDTVLKQSKKSLIPQLRRGRNFFGMSLFGKARMRAMASTQELQADYVGLDGRRRDDDDDDSGSSEGYSPPDITALMKEEEEEEEEVHVADDISRRVTAVRHEDLEASGDDDDDDEIHEMRLRGHDRTRRWSSMRRSRHSISEFYAGSESGDEGGPDIVFMGEDFENAMQEVQNEVEL